MSETERNLIVFSSNHHLIRAEHKLKKRNIPITLYPSPPEFKEKCLTAIAFPARFKEEIEAILHDNHIEVQGTYPFDANRLQKTEALIKAQLKKDSQTEIYLKSILLDRVEMCIADQDKIRVFANFSNDISEVLPYLNSIFPNASYDHGGPTLTFMKGPTLITLYPKQVAAAKVENETAAALLLEWIRNCINDTHRNKDSMTPCCERKIRLSPVEIYKYLPKTNCQKCGGRTCLAFAVKVLSGEEKITSCTLLQSPDFEENGAMLFQLLAAMGFDL